MGPPQLVQANSAQGVRTQAIDEWGCPSSVVRVELLARLISLKPT